MTPAVVAPAPAGVLYRLGRLPDPLVWPDWRYVGGGRFDDPQRTFRTLYAAEQRLTCFVELLAAFRPSPEALSQLRRVSGTEDPYTFGAIPIDWVHKRCFRAFRLRPGQRCLDLRPLETREMLRRELPEVLVRLGLADLDVSGVRGPYRELTQAIARWAYEHGFAGLAYRSRFDDQLDCWAIFEGADIEPCGDPQPVSSDDPDLAVAAALFDLTVGPTRSLH
jgi:RES domain-containing protein